MRFLLAVWFLGLLAIASYGQCPNGSCPAPAGIRAVPVQRMTVYERRVEYVPAAQPAPAVRYLTVQPAAVPIPVVTYVPAARASAVPAATVYTVPLDVRAYDTRGPIRRFFNTR